MIKEIEEIEQYFKNFKKGQNITITKAFLDNLDVLFNSINDLKNKIDSLEDEIEWWKQQCDDLDMQIGEIYD